MSDLANSPASGNSPAVIIPAKSTDENVILLKPLLDECQTHCGAINPRSSHSAQHERRYKREIFLLSMAFLFVFSAFGATQNLQTSINREAGLGSVTLGVFYASFTICSFVAPAVVQSLGSKHAMLAGFCGFWIYLFANFWPTWAVLVPASLFLGFSASILWVAQGTYLSSVAKAHAAQLGSSEGGSMGEFNGRFWSVQALNQVAGNLTVLVICSALEGSTRVTAGTIQPTTRLTLLAVFLVSMTGGTMAACFLPTEPEGKSNGRKRSSVLSWGREFAGVLGEKRLQLLIPLLFYSGLQRAFIWMSFTRDLVSPLLGVAGIGATMVVYGLTDSMSSMISGRLSTGPAAVFKILRIGLACQAAVIIVVALQFSEALALPRSSVSSLYVGAILWAVGAGALNTQISALLPLQFPHHTAAAFSHWKFWQSGATAAACLIDPWVSMGQRQGMLMVTLLASVLTLSCSTAADGDDDDDDGYVGDVA